MTTTGTTWRAQKSNGPRPLCNECRREEAISGGLCESCGPRLRAQKKAAAEKLKACHEIAERLYRKDGRRFKDLFAWINSQVKKRKSLTLVLHSLERLESLNLFEPEPQSRRPSTRSAEAHDRSLEPLNSLGPRGDVWAYLEGTLRRLEEKSEATKLRRGGMTAIGDLCNLRKFAATKGDK